MIKDGYMNGAIFGGEVAKHLERLEAQWHSIVRSDNIYVGDMKKTARELIAALDMFYIAARKNPLDDCQDPCLKQP